MERSRNIILKIILLIYLFGQLVVGMEALRINNQFYTQFGQKLLVKGDIIKMDYFNKTFPEVNFNIIDNFNLNRMEHFYNLTIGDHITNSIIYCSLEIGIIEKFDIQIGNIIFIYRNPPFIEVTGSE